MLIKWLELIEVGVSAGDLHKARKLVSSDVVDKTLNKVVIEKKLIEVQEQIAQKP